MPQSDVDALKWASLAANHGHVLAQYNLGIMYASGRGAPQDEVEATKWYRLAAEQGYVLAQSSLGLRYSNGQGVPKDPVQALKWLTIAVARGDSRAVNDLEAIKQSMAPLQIVEARKLAKEWKPSAPQQ